MFYVKAIAVIIALVIMVGGVYLAFKNREPHGGDTKGASKGMGARFVQVLTVILLIPSIFILAVLELISESAVGAMFGTLIGYVLAKVGEFVPSGRDGQ